MNHMLLIFSLLACLDGASSFVSFLDTTRLTDKHRFIRTATPLLLLNAKKAKKKKSGGGGGGAGLKGFGAAVVTNKKSSNIETDRSKQTRKFYDYLETNRAGDNLKRTALGFIPVSDTFKLRGVVATRDIAKGSDIINIPYELALNLGPEGEDPTRPAVAFLKDYCTILNNDDNNPKQDYYRMLPGFRSDDCLGSCDFFSDDALEALQSPLIVEETKQRRAQTASRFAQEDFSNMSWIDGTSITVEHLLWAVWLITSRVLTVQGGDESSASSSFRLLIPYLDMCNHDRSSPHVLTGRAVPGGQLRVVAGANVQPGDPINICYGGGVAGNDRFVQDYGFLDDNDAAYDLVAQEILGKRRIREGANAGKTMSMVDQERTLEALRATRIADDEAALSLIMSSSKNEGGGGDPAMESAIRFRLGLKRALSKFIVMP